MRIDLTDTTASHINKALVRGRRAIGSPAVGMVLTMVVVTDEENAHDALKAAEQAAQEHPSRTLVVIRRPSRTTRRHTPSRVDAEVRVGSDAGSGEAVLLRLFGEVAEHADSVVLPLLLPDAPVVVWWPVDGPDAPAKDPLGALAQRRITDAYAVDRPLERLAARAGAYAPGDTDLAWTRLTPWRSMLAAALDQAGARVTSAVVESEADNPSAELLARWFADRLRVPVERVVTGGPVVTAVRLRTTDGDVLIDRPEGAVARLSIPGQPTRALALKVRTTAELIAEELRRLDPDEAYAAALRAEVRAPRAKAVPAMAPAAKARSTKARSTKAAPVPPQRAHQHENQEKHDA
ncbi:glucose-6-phosphate dehydrogenase assembly protein OpcA [Actinacidiphila glaucinigra]|uniref:glucose-6-phosphate dehydrogenase assembly protein OpcA n=1 Tax=Actinacidiphila glaucinigra TaxID=235986 RepID=UPI002E2FF18D|nr:glucose-6-phosphate dehydrogenase assembly protein OpcA [Actinacidiphila glaucinigra]